jgi:hypothetical protein
VLSDVCWRDGALGLWLRAVVELTGMAPDRVVSERATALGASALPPCVLPSSRLSVNSLWQQASMQMGLNGQPTMQRIR